MPARRVDVGLPARADLLAELTLADRGLDRLRLALGSLGRWEGALWTSFAGLGGWAAWLALGAWRSDRCAARGMPDGESKRAATVLPEL